MKKKIQGIITALVTPFDSNNQINYTELSSFLRWQISENISGLVVGGTTGESATISHEEHVSLIEVLVKEVNNSNRKDEVVAIAGTGSNSTEEALYLSKTAEKIGVDALLIITPYYNNPPQHALYEHFKEIHDNTSLPIILYNVPGRTSVDLHNDTIIKLSKLERIVGIKDATGNLVRPLELHTKIGADFIQLSGEDATAVKFNIGGGSGCISVMSNVVPNLCAQMQNACLEKNYEIAIDLQFKLFKLSQVLFCETNPSPIKYAMSILKNAPFKIHNILRKPLLKASPESEEKIRKALLELNIEVN